MSLPVRPGSCSNLWHDAFQGKSQAACVLTLLLNSVWLCTFVWWWNSLFFFSAFFGSVTRLYGLLCPIMEWWPSDIVLGYIFLKCESICVLLLVKKGKTFLLFFLIYFRFVTMKKNKQISNGMAVKQWQSDSLIQLVILLNGNNKIYHDAFCFYLFTYRLVFLCDVWRLSDAFPCHIYLCLETDERGEGWGLERGIIEVFASVYVCVWVSLSLLSITPITASHFILVTTLSRSLAHLLFPFTLPVSPSPTLKVQFKSAQLSLHPAVSLYTCQTFTLLPVFVLQSGFWRGLSGRRGRGKPIRCCIERTPVVLVSGFSIGTQTSVQALSGGSLLQMHMLCNNTDCFWEKKMCACLRTLSFFLFLSVHAFVNVTKFNQHFRFHMSPECSVFRS